MPTCQAMTPRHIIAAVAALWLMAPAAAWAQTTTPGDAIVAKVDAKATATADFSASIHLVTKEKSGDTTSRHVNIWQKGHAFRMVKLTAPSRLKNVGFLARDEQLYLYLPAFGKVRRVAPRQRGESFFGSNFTQDDLTRTRFVQRFTARIKAEDNTQWTLRLDPRKPQDETYHHVVIKVQKRMHVVTEMTFFTNAAGPPVRRVIASDFRVEGATPLAYKVVADDLITQSRSTATLSKVRVAAGLSDDFFTKRQLKR